MAAYTAYEPQWVATGGITGPRTGAAFPAQQATWRQGDLLQLVTTGTIITPTGGAGTLAAVAGPSLGSAPVPFNVNGSAYSVTQGAVRVTAAANAAYPAQTLFGVVTYTTGAQTNETLSSVPFLINTIAGIQPSVNVLAANAPATATSYSLYIGFLPNTWYSQAQNIALGTLTAITYPLTNSIGVNQSAANPSANIVGLANVDSDAYFAGILGATAGGSQMTGKRSLFGATQSFGPGWSNDAFALPITKLQVGMLEISLVQGWSPSLVYTGVGFSIDPATGYFVADTSQSNKIATIQKLAFSPGYSGQNPGDTMARVLVQFNSGLV